MLLGVNLLALRIPAYFVSSNGNERRGQVYVMEVVFKLPTATAYEDDVRSMICFIEGQ